MKSTMKSEMMIYDPVLAVAFSKNHDKLLIGNEIQFI